MSTSDDERVPVRVKDLERWAGWFAYFGKHLSAEVVRAYLPKPKLVTVDLDELKALLGELDDMKLSRLIQRLEKEA